MFVAYFATILKEVSCGKLSDAMNTGDCFVSFDSTAHRLTGVVVGFALSHIAHVAYRKWYEVLVALDDMYDSARSINVMAATCFGHNNGNTSAKKSSAKQRGLFTARKSATEEELSKQEALSFFFSVDSVNKGGVNPNVLRERVRRLLDLALVFARRTVRDHRLGVPMYSQTAGSDIENTRKAGDPAANFDSTFTLKPLDPYDIADSSVGVPSIADVFTHMGHDTKLKDAILATSHQSRASACVAELQRTVEFARKNALVSDGRFRLLQSLRELSSVSDDYTPSRGHASSYVIPTHRAHRAILLRILGTILVCQYFWMALAGTGCRIGVGILRCRSSGRRIDRSFSVVHARTRWK